MSQPTDHAASAPARYLGIVQFFFLSSWTVYAIFLPDLLESAGIARQWTIWVLMADQILFALFDIAAGFATDRIVRLYGRIGPWVVGATVISCLSFLLLPWVATTGDPAWRVPVLLGLTAIWAVSSSALRAPAFTMISRHAATPRLPALVGPSLIGMAVAGAIAPYLGSSLRQLDPRLPFAISSLALLLLASGLIWAERNASGQSSVSAPQNRAPRLRPGLFFPLLAIAALGYQILFHLNTAPRYLRDAGVADLVWLMPVFWIGFNGSATFGSRLSRRVSATQLFVIACATGALGAAIATMLPGLGAATAGQLIAGFAWGAALVAAFGITGELTSTAASKHKATLNGLLFSMLALATFVRIGIHSAGLPQHAEWTSAFVMMPILIWAGIAIVIAWVAVKTDRTRTPQ